MSAMMKSNKLELHYRRILQWLKLADNFESAGTVNNAITHVWIAHPDIARRSRLDDGVHNIKQTRLLTTFVAVKQLVIDDPQYGEAWSLMAMCCFGLNQQQAALEAAKKAIELIPQHYNAMSLQGVTHLSMGQHAMAAQMLGDCVSLDPWSTAANQLSAALDLMHNK